jgi:hypothetical protein
LGWHTCFVPQLLHAAGTVGATWPVHEPPELLPPLLLPPLLDELEDEEEDEELDDPPDELELEPGFFVLPDVPELPEAVAPASDPSDAGLFAGSVVVGVVGVGSVGCVVVSAPLPVPVSVAPTAHAGDAASATPVSNATLSGARQAARRAARRADVAWCMRTTSVPRHLGSRQVEGVC